MKLTARRLAHLNTILNNAAEDLSQKISSEYPSLFAKGQRIAFTKNDYGKNVMDANISLSFEDRPHGDES
jgi:hypothetical protein